VTVIVDGSVTLSTLGNRSVMVVVAGTESPERCVIVPYKDGSHLLGNRDLPGIVLAQTM
jgi:hypothetical protein